MAQKDPHGGQPVVSEGARLDQAEAAVILLHGRGATAKSILHLTEAFPSDGVAYLAPEAKHREWFPWSFTAPVEDNQPKVGSALGLVGDLYREVYEAGLSAESIGLVGFSQGACLAAEFVASNTRRYGCLGVLSGGLIGHEPVFGDYDGSLERTPAFFGCGGEDIHVPIDRFERTVDIFGALAGDVTATVYEGMNHSVNADEVEEVTRLVESLV